MITKEIIERFYRDVDSLGLKFPVATIAEATGTSKGNVSKYLSKKIAPSEAFINAFYDKVYKSSRQVSKETIEQPEAQEKNDVDTTRLLIATLQDHNKTLKDQLHLQSSLSALLAELKSNRELLVTLINGTTARGETMMAFLEKLTKLKHGSLFVESDKKERDLQQRQFDKGKTSGADKSSK